MDPDTPTFVGPSVFDRGRLADLLYLSLHTFIDEDLESLFFGNGGDLEGSSKDGEGSEPLVEGSSRWEGGNCDDRFTWNDGICCIEAGLSTSASTMADNDD